MEKRLSNILFIVEGSKTEPAIIKRLSDVFHFNANIYSVNANIYAIYQAVKDDPFANIVKVVSEMTNSESDKTILNKKFTDVFLVFDCDSHHTTNRLEAAQLSIQEIANKNIEIVQEMVKRFDESTDPERGKLLINYPMVESFRDCDDFFDKNYSNTNLPIDKVKDYKKIVSSRKMASAHIEHFTYDNFANLIRMNSFKLNQIISGKFEVADYSKFLMNYNQEKIAQKESEFIKKQSIIAVLNTLLLFPIEYFGNTNNFYDNIVS